jgi:MoaA/NifB/PqqE/SkfB family radical SAM enzyme
VQLDVTYRCNERCVHCYLDHDDHGEMTTAEIKDLLDQMADAGVFFLVLSGGEIFCAAICSRSSGTRASSSSRSSSRPTR